MWGRCVNTFLTAKQIYEIPRRAKKIWYFVFGKIVLFRKKCDFRRLAKRICYFGVAENVCIPQKGGRPSALRKNPFRVGKTPIVFRVTIILIVFPRIDLFSPTIDLVRVQTLGGNCTHKGGGRLSDREKSKRGSRTVVRLPLGFTYRSTGTTCLP